MKTQTPLPEDFIDVATLNLSGERLIVGYRYNVDDCTVVLQQDLHQPIDFTPIQAHLLIAALKSAIERCGVDA